jgi:hypothetical protein
MDWIRYLLGKPAARPQADRKAFERREAELRDRYERLERLAIEADVIARTDHHEDRPWPEQ